MDKNLTPSEDNTKKNRTTQFIILSLTGVLTQLSWGFYHGALYGEKSWLWSLIFFSLSLVVIALSWLLIKSKLVLVINNVLILLSFLTFFSSKVQYLTAVFIAFLLLLTGALLAQREKNQRLKIQWFRVFRRGLPAAMTGLLLLLTVGFFYSASDDIPQAEFKIPRNVFNVFAQPFVSMTKGEIASSIAEELEGRGASNISLPEEYEGLIDLNQVSASVTKEEIAKMINEKEIENMLYELIHKQINRQNGIAGEYSQYYSLGLAFAFFAALGAISYPLMFIIILLGGLIYWVLLKTKAIRISEEAAIKEFIEI